MTPSFLTPAYIDACRAAEHVQGWWTATWTETPAAGLMEERFLGVDSRGTLVRSREAHFVPSAQPPWALPPIGTGLQTNVRVGDFLFGQGPGTTAFGATFVTAPTIHCITGRSTEVGTNGPAVSFSGCDLAELAPGLVFLPRLDQLLWLCMLRQPDMETLFRLLDDGAIGRGNSMDLRAVEPVLLTHAETNLARLGCPARRLT